MLHLYFGDTATVFLTLSEQVTLDPPRYLFVFYRRVPGDTVAAVLTPVATNERAEQFTIHVDELFAGAATGQYTYIVYEQADTDNTDPAGAGAEIERGIMMLHKESPFAYTQRTSTTTFIQPAD